MGAIAGPAGTTYSGGSVVTAPRVPAEEGETGDDERPGDEGDSGGDTGGDTGDVEGESGTIVGTVGAALAGGASSPR
jgi:hypothetical protein